MASLPNVNHPQTTFPRLLTPRLLPPPLPHRPRQSPLINRIGAPPPTGPRSLLNGGTNTSSRSAKPTPNGHTNPLTGQRQLPSGPSAMQQKPPLKGKQVEIKWSDQAIASTSRNSEPGPSSNAARPTPLAVPNLNGKSSSGWSSSFSTIAQPVPVAPRAATSRSHRDRQPPQPSSEPPPPPPPPPSITPPPPPPSL
ncbi:hypothetical protein EDB92DRAFT_724200 [Lactarius akahatsu]|uniref:Uncharacterized protein n=1 Tax=Lactarius akahatsu TaxID=416441 RepID=A0AAD4LH86_9AGAM|nr:hypothetical protein EDB92DRAFT_724200 [Lactarius akahatsu]